MSNIITKGQIMYTTTGTLPGQFLYDIILAYLTHLYRDISVEQIHILQDRQHPAVRILEIEISFQHFPADSFQVGFYEHLVALIDLIHDLAAEPLRSGHVFFQFSDPKLYLFFFVVKLMQLVLRIGMCILKPDATDRRGLWKPQIRF